MRITDVYVGYLKITRIIQIGSILVKHGFKEMISHTFLGRRIRKRRIRQHKPVYTTQERLRLTIEDLGPTYIKFGQILADRPESFVAVNILGTEDPLSRKDLEAFAEGIDFSLL